MPRPRLERSYDAVIARKVADSLRNGESIQTALKEVDYLPSDHFNLLETSVVYKQQIDNALRDRSMLLLDESIDLAKRLDHELASSTDVSAVKVKADILKTLAYSHDARLRISNNNNEQREEQSYATFLEGLSSNKARDKSVPTTTKLTLDSVYEPLSTDDEDAGLTH